MTTDTIRAIYAELEDMHRRLGELTRRLGEALEEPKQPDATASAIAGPVIAEAEAEQYTAPLVFINGGAPEAAEELYPNGIDGVLGRPLLRIDTVTATQIARGSGRDRPELEKLYKAKGHSGLLVLGTVSDFDQSKVEEARWAVVVSAAEDAALLQALWPLIRHRMQQMGCARLDFDFRQGENCGEWWGRHSDGLTKTLADGKGWGQVPAVLIVRPGDLEQGGVRVSDPVSTWLGRHGVAQGPVDPTCGVPFYLLIAARPGPIIPGDQSHIPFDFQYELDIFWGVGRLAFTDAAGQHILDDYRTYAERVVAWETRADAAARLRREIAFFGTRHEEDKATIASSSELIPPLLSWAQQGLPGRIGFGSQAYVAEQATRANLERLLGGGDDGRPPALLFTASHGVGFPMGDSRLVMQQGALLTGDFEGFGGAKREHWLAGEDLIERTSVEGMIALLFACYGAGCPAQDEFVFDNAKKRVSIAPFPFVAQLPQRLLAKGALAVLGHVERAWPYSFRGTAGATGQTQPFQDVLSRLVQGSPVGDATDQFNVIQASRSMTLLQELESLDSGAPPMPAQIASLWIARNDARNYALLGDPAVKLAV